LNELAVAIAVDPTDECYDNSRKLDDDEKILEICSSFVKMDESTRIVENEIQVPGKEIYFIVRKPVIKSYHYHTFLSITLRFNCLLKV
jgi:hypothetical protein